MAHRSRRKVAFVSKTTTTMESTNIGAEAAQRNFPILKPFEIIHCIKELEIDFSEPELLDPIRHKEKLRTVWLGLVRV